MPSYGLSYTPAPAPSFPTPSFPVPQHTVDYFRAGTATPFSLHDEPSCPIHIWSNATRLRYHSPGHSNPPNSSRHAKPEPKPPSAPAPGTRSTIQNEGERAARKLQHREDENARARREQEERDAELARTLDLELNLDRSRNDAQGGLVPAVVSTTPRRNGGKGYAWCMVVKVEVGRSDEWALTLDA
ncbi:hypothetical protein B0F90DRAFT_1301979 [Multifurca ochricompacta]|uniref:Uncharacterized protein n=1 Tax=Multifurca ochricompacta TaxID=376703 RepID=A0AAD4M6L0_9AGAM|nr:hypothetical protein B0F90DRAFT_1301979 [Multifurca ochricompacta]